MAVEIATCVQVASPFLEEKPFGACFNLTEIPRNNSEQFAPCRLFLNGKSVA